MQENTNLSHEDYLRIHLENLEKPQTKSIQLETESDTVKIETNRTNSLQFFTFDIQELPCGFFYPAGCTLQIRAAQVKEIQAYSMVDDNNPYDIIEKMNDVLSNCVRIKYTNGQVGSYMDLKDADRFYLIFLIRELTFQRGTVLTSTAKCSCGLDVTIELVRQNFIPYDVDEDLVQYFDRQTQSFKFTLTNGKVYHLSAPSIGVRKAFTDYIVKENLEKRRPDLSFIKIIPYTIFNKSTISQEELMSKLEEFQNMDDVSFQFLNAAVEKMSFGIEKLHKVCQCGLEIHTDMIFPHRSSTIFVIHDAFDKFIKK